MAAAARGNLLMPAKTEILLTPEGRLMVKSSMTDIGTGTYTVLTQIAAEMLGLSPEQVDTQLGDTDFPEGAGIGRILGRGQHRLIAVLCL